VEFLALLAIFEHQKGSFPEKPLQDEKPESWHGVCFIKVGLWLQPGRKNFEILGGESSETPTGLLFFEESWRHPAE
jgi:hypothetical protein